MQPLVSFAKLPWRETSWLGFTEVDQHNRLSFLLPSIDFIGFYFTHEQQFSLQTLRTSIISQNSQLLTWKVKQFSLLDDTTIYDRFPFCISAISAVRFFTHKMKKLYYRCFSVASLGPWKRWRAINSNARSFSPPLYEAKFELCWFDFQPEGKESSRYRKS